MFVEEWQFFETPFFEPVKGFKDLPLEEGEVDFFNFDENNNGVHNLHNEGFHEHSMEDWWQLPTPDSESGGGYAPLSDSAVGSQTTPVDFPLRTSVPGILEPAPVQASSASSSFPVCDGFPLDSEQLFDPEREGDFDNEEQFITNDEEEHVQMPVVGSTSVPTPTPRYVKQPRQNRYSGSSSPKGRRVSDSRLSAQGLAEVLNLESPDEALKRERFILDIFETELHYPLGYKTWVRDTSKPYRAKLIEQLHDRVRGTYPEYDKGVLETIIRRATYYMMQSRLRRERRAKAKSRRESASSSN